MSSLIGNAFFCAYLQFKKEQANIICIRSLIQINFQNIFHLKCKLSQVFVIALPD